MKYLNLIMLVLKLLLLISLFAFSYLLLLGEFESQSFGIQEFIVVKGVGIVFWIISYQYFITLSKKYKITQPY